MKGGISKIKTYSVYSIGVGSKAAQLTYVVVAWNIRIANQTALCIHCGIIHRLAESNPITCVSILGEDGGLLSVLVICVLRDGTGFLPALLC